MPKFRNEDVFSGKSLTDQQLVSKMHHKCFDKKKETGDYNFTFKHTFKVSFYQWKNNKFMCII